MISIQIIETIKIFLASYELVITSLLLLLFLIFQSFFRELGYIAIKTNTLFDLLNYFEGGCLLFSIGYSWKILKPKENNKNLYQWKDYWKIKSVVFVSIFIVFSCAVIYYLTYLFKTKITPETLAFLLLVTIINPVVTIWNLIIAAFKINEIIDEFN
jgi:hypothetical protein